MKCPLCEQPMSERTKHEFIRGSGGPPYEFKVHVCHSAGRGYEPGERVGARRCEETLFYEPVLPNGNPARGLPLLITGLDRTPCPADQPGCGCQGSMARVEEDAHDG